MSGAGDAAIGRLVAQLESVVAELDEISFDRLREAVADGATARPESDKALTQARRAIEKALGALQRLASGSDAGNPADDD